jgi:hypothetical protein
MEDVFQITGHMYKLADIMIVELEVLQGEQMFNISQVACNEIVHPDYVISFFQESLTQMTS